MNDEIISNSKSVCFRIFQRHHTPAKSFSSSLIEYCCQLVITPEHYQVIDFRKLGCFILNERHCYIDILCITKVMIYFLSKAS